MREAVLLVNFKDRKKLLEIQKILMSAKVLMKKVSKEEYAQPVGALAGVKELYKEDAVYEGGELEKDMMVFANVSSAKLDYILGMLRRKALTRVDYKAVLTPTNMEWTVPELYEELSLEHEAMKNQ